MSRITKVKVEIIEEDEDGNESFSDLSSPTIEMAIEKLGSFERSQENMSDVLADVLKAQELEAEGMIKIEQ